jgi:hypothetical protein
VGADPRCDAQGVHPKNRKALAARVAQAAGAALREKGHATAIDVMLGIGWLQASHVLEWRTRRLPFLERGIQANVSKVSEAMRLFAAWAKNGRSERICRARGLAPQVRARG